jgi:sn-glycerol 3-phosphate transport system substrate-binding protein
MAKPKNSIIGGATLWVFKGHKPEEYKGVADFFSFLNKTENQIWWHQNTGYLPLTKMAYEQLKKDGYYKKEPTQEIAVLQLMRTPPTENSKGIRIGNYSQVRDIIDEEFEKIWAGSSTVDQALNNAADRSNKTLEQYRRTVR